MRVSLFLMRQANLTHCHAGGMRDAVMQITRDGYTALERGANTR